MLALGSYENRVYQVGIEETTPLVAKFYRPARWSNAAIAEEHAFAHELAAAELPVVAPLLRAKGSSLLVHEGFRFSLYPRQGGRSPELESRENLEWMGRLLARMHGVGSRGVFAERGRIDVESFVRMPARAVLASELLAFNLAADAISESTLALAELLDAPLEAIGPLRQIRLHGDCHLGNVLWTDAGPHFVDLDDARMGPCRAGPVDARAIAGGAYDPARRLCRIPRVRPGRIGPDRTAAHHAPGALGRLGGDALARSGVSDGLRPRRRGALVGGTLQ